MVGQIGHRLAQACGRKCKKGRGKHPSLQGLSGFGSSARANADQHHIP